MVNYTLVIPDGDPPGWPCPLYPNPKSSLKRKVAQQCLAQIDAIIALIQTTQTSNDNTNASAPPATRPALALPPYTIPSVPAWQHEHLCLYDWMTRTGLGEWGDGTDKEVDNAAAGMPGNGEKARMRLGALRRTLLKLSKDLAEVLTEMRAALNGELTPEHEEWLRYEPFGLTDLESESRVVLVHAMILDLYAATAKLDGLTAGFEPREVEGVESVEEQRERREREKEERKGKWERYHEVMGHEEESDDDEEEEEEDGEEEEVTDAINELTLADQQEAEAAAAKAAAEEGEDRWNPGIEELDRETYEALRKEEARKGAVVEERYIQKYDTQLQFWNEGRYEMVDMTEAIPQLTRRGINVVELDEEGNEMAVFKGGVDDEEALQGRRFWRKGTESLISCGSSKRNRMSVMVRVPVPECWRKESREPGEVERLWKGMQWQNIHEDLGF